MPCPSPRPSRQCRQPPLQFPPQPQPCEGGRGGTGQRPWSSESLSSGFVQRWSGLLRGLCTCSGDSALPGMQSCLWGDEPVWGLDVAGRGSCRVLPLGVNVGRGASPFFFPTRALQQLLFLEGGGKVYCILALAVFPPVCHGAERDPFGLF